MWVGALVCCNAVRVWAGRARSLFFFRREWNHNSLSFLSRASPRQSLFLHLQPCPAKKAAKPRCVCACVCARQPRLRTPGVRRCANSPFLSRHSLPLTPRPSLLLPTQPLKKPKAKQADLDDDDKAFLQKKKEEAAALKALKEKAASKGGFAKVKGSK